MTSYKFHQLGAKAYGALNKRHINDLLSGARVDPTELKSDPHDFALWKGAKPGEPSWDSPWGPGRPGWHIECSAMALHALGEQIDVHGGGADLIFPHHTNEIAQTEAYTGKSPFARIWMHNALLQLSGDKMSKSLGNLVTIAEALDQYGGDALRMFVISSHYRSPSSYTDDALDAAKSGVERLRNAAFSASGRGERLEPGDTRQRFSEATDGQSLFGSPQGGADLGVSAVASPQRSQPADAWSNQSAQAAILSALGEPATIDRLCELTGLSPQELQGELTLLELQGRVRQSRGIVSRKS